MHLEVFQIFKVMLAPSPTTPRHWIKLAETYCNSFPEPNHSIWKDTIPNGQSSFLVWSTMLVSRRLANPLLQRKIAELEDTSAQKYHSFQNIRMNPWTWSLATLANVNIHINRLSVRGYDNIDEGFSGLFCSSAQLVQVRVRVKLKGDIEMC